MTDSATASFHDARNPMLLSYSGIAAYQTCRHRWKLQNVYGLKTALATRPMDLGSAVHAGIEHYLKLLGTTDEGIDRWVDGKLNSIPEDDDGESLGEGTIEDHLEGIRANAKTVARRVVDEIIARELTSYEIGPDRPLVEMEIIRPLPNWDGFAVHIDWVAVDSMGRVWIVDFKVRSSFYGDDSEDVSLQNPIYQKIFFDETGIEAAGTLTFQVRSDPMKIPKLTKKGDMSRAAIVCDWETYRAELLKHRLNPADYQDMKDKLSTVEFTRVIEAARSMDTVNRIWDSIVQPLSVEMARIRDRAMSPSRMDRKISAKQAQRTLSHRTCTGCNVRDVCLNALKGWDVSTELSRYRFRDEIVRTAVKEGTL